MWEYLGICSGVKNLKILFWFKIGINIYGFFKKNLDYFDISYFLLYICRFVNNYWF